MYHWDDIPFFRLLLPFASGILVSFYFQFPDINLFASGFLAFSLVFIFFHAYKGLSFPWQFRHIPSVILLFSVFLLGMLLTQFKSDKSNPYHFSHFPNEHQILARVVNDPEPSSSSIKTIVECEASVGKNPHRLSGKVMTFLALDSNSLKLEYGDFIILNFTPSKVKPVTNDFEFNYHRFLLSKNISHTLYLNSGDWKSTGINKGNPVLKLGYYARDRFVKIFSRLLGSGEESAIVSGMFCGYRADMSAETMASFSNTGVIHIMSVSGLHVGVIYLMLGFLLSFIPWINRKKTIKLIIALSVIWFYTILTGLSASIIRAAVMISFIAIGEIARQKINPVNSVSAAAFILLTINPFSIFDIGFQLSFSAVLGIFLFYTPIKNLFKVKNKILKSIWELSALSIAAQLATFPLTSYYFHQFPVYFLLANLFAVPLSGLIIYVSFALLVLGEIPYLGNIVAWALQWIVKILVKGVGMIESFPYSSIKGIYPSITVSLITLFSIFLFWYAFVHKSKKILSLSLLSVLTASILSVTNKYERSGNHFTNIYNKSGNLIISQKQGSELIISYAVLSPQKLGRQRQLLQNAIDYYQIKNIRVINLLSNKKHYSARLYYKQPFFYIQNTLIIFDPQNKFKKKIKHPHLTLAASKWEIN